MNTDDAAVLKALDESALWLTVAADGRIRSANSRFRDLLGASAMELAEMNFYALVRASHGEFFAQQIAEAVAECGKWRGELSLSSRSGFSIWVEGELSPLVFEQGREPSLIFVGFNISDRKLTDKALIESERNLRIAKNAAEEAARVKSRFLANMSHEIRTPMNGILGMTDLVLETDLTAEQREWLETVQSCSNSLLTILNDILDISKLEAGRLSLCPNTIQLRPFLQRTVALFSASAGEKGITVVGRADPAVPARILMDETRVGQVLNNLIGNAIKFSHAGALVDVRVRVDPPEPGSLGLVLHFSVQDSGIGIPPDRVEVIFDAFTQADSSTTRRFGGTGLGLTICRQIAGLMGGRTWAESTVGKGSTFHFTMHAQAVNDDDGSVVAGSRALTSAEAATIAPISILLAEDNAVNRLLAVLILEKLGHRVTVVENGAIAVERFKGEPFDLILMDCAMPEMDGFDATRAIRELEKGSEARIPIVALTASALDSDRQICFDAGMDDYLSKPFRKDDLLRMLAKWAPA